MKCGYEIMKSLKASKPINDSSVYDYTVKKETEDKPIDVCKIAGLNKFKYVKILFYFLYLFRKKFRKLCLLSFHT